MEKKKFKLSQPTEEEKSTFMKEFTALCDKHSMYFEPVPSYSRDTFETPWQLVCQIWLQKKIEIVEVEKAVPSPFTDKKNEDNSTVA